MLEDVVLKIDEIYVPVKQRRTLDPAKVEETAEDIVATDGRYTPVQVRRDESRFVLVSGLHRLEALKAVGEDTVEALIVHARRY